jgi:hypothetical protein
MGRRRQSRGAVRRADLHSVGSSYLLWVVVPLAMNASIGPLSRA